MGGYSLHLPLELVLARLANNQIGAFLVHVNFISHGWVELDLEILPAIYLLLLSFEVSYGHLDPGFSFF